jgi:hypothetical protein
LLSLSFSAARWRNSFVSSHFAQIDAVRLLGSLAQPLDLVTDPGNRVVSPRLSSRPLPEPSSGSHPIGPCCQMYIPRAGVHTNANSAMAYKKARPRRCLSLLTCPLALPLRCARICGLPWPCLLSAGVLTATSVSRNAERADVALVFVAQVFDSFSFRPSDCEVEGKDTEVDLFRAFDADAFLDGEPALRALSLFLLLHSKISGRCVGRSPACLLAAFPFSALAFP